MLRTGPTLPSPREELRWARGCEALLSVVSCLLVLLSHFYANCPILPSPSSFLLPSPPMPPANPQHFFFSPGARRQHEGLAGEEESPGFSVCPPGALHARISSPSPSSRFQDDPIPATFIIANVLIEQLDQGLSGRWRHSPHLSDFAFRLYTLPTSVHVQYKIPTTSLHPNHVNRAEEHRYGAKPYSGH